MAKWFVSAVGAIDQWEDFVQEAFLVLWEKREKLAELDCPKSRKRYAAAVVWNHWKKAPEKVTYFPELIEKPVANDGELFFELAIGHLNEIVSGRAKLVLRELVWPSIKFQQLLKETMLRKKHLGERPVEPVLSTIAEMLEFRISDYITEIKTKTKETIGTIGIDF